MSINEAKPTKEFYDDLYSGRLIPTNYLNIKDGDGAISQATFRCKSIGITTRADGIRVSFGDKDGKQYFVLGPFFSGELTLLSGGGVIADITILQKLTISDLSNIPEGDDGGI